MSLHNVTPGAKAPDEFNVIIEIPMNADPIKYEVDKDSGAHVRRPLHDHRDALPVQLRLHAAAPCPTTATRSTCWSSRRVPLTPGVVVTCRPIGMLKMEDEAGGDDKVLAVPTSKILPMYDHWQKPADVNPMRLKRSSTSSSTTRTSSRTSGSRSWAGKGPKRREQEIASGMAAWPS